MKYLPSCIVVLCVVFSGCSNTPYPKQIKLEEVLREGRHTTTQPGSNRTITLNQDFVLRRHQSDSESNVQLLTLKSGTYRHVSSSKDYLFFRPDNDGLMEVKKAGEIVLSQRVDWGIAVSSTNMIPSFIYSEWSPEVAMRMWEIDIEDFSYSGEPTWQRNY